MTGRKWPNCTHNSGMYVMLHCKLCFLKMLGDGLIVLITPVCNASLQAVHCNDAIGLLALHFGWNPLYCTPLMVFIRHEVLEPSFN